ncbi:MAG: YciI family protein [Actinomycetota bacterium]
MARYMLLIYGDERQWGTFSPEEQAQEFKLYDEYTDWLREKGWYLAGEPLHPTAAATSVQVRDGKTLTTDGPFAETKEQLGGYYLVQVESLDEAIGAASRIPAARGGTIEVRPIFETERMTP